MIVSLQAWSEKSCNPVSFYALHRRPVCAAIASTHTSVYASTNPNEREVKKRNRVSKTAPNPNPNHKPHHNSTLFTDPSERPPKVMSMRPILTPLPLQVSTPASLPGRTPLIRLNTKLNLPLNPQSHSHVSAQGNLIRLPTPRTPTPPPLNPDMRAFGSLPSRAVPGARSGGGSGGVVGEGLRGKVVGVGVAGSGRVFLDGVQSVGRV